jgi:tetratricopeptide (TPR) repeat protein
VIAQFSDRSQVMRVREHSLWLIERCPTATVHQCPAIQLRLDAEGHAAAASLWLGHAIQAPDNLGILRNAAAFFASTDFPRAKVMLERGEALDPENPDWSCSLGDLLSLEAHRCHEFDRTLANEALASLQRALTKSDNRARRASTLGSLAALSLLLGELDIASEYARELLCHQTGPLTLSRDGDAIYTGHSVLGSVALQRGNVDEACRELLEAGKAPESPVLVSFGPEFDLANALLQRGRREVVVEFLRCCATYWEPERVDRWIDQILAGRTPTLDRRE